MKFKSKIPSKEMILVTIRRHQTPSFYCKLRSRTPHSTCLWLRRPAVRLTSTTPQHRIKMMSDLTLRMCTRQNQGKNKIQKTAVCKPQISTSSASQTPMNSKNSKPKENSQSIGSSARSTMTCNSKRKVKPQLNKLKSMTVEIKSPSSRSCKKLSCRFYPRSNANTTPRCWSTSKSPLVRRHPLTAP